MDNTQRKLVLLQYQLTTTSLDKFRQVLFCPKLNLRFDIILVLFLSSWLDTLVLQQNVKVLTGAS